MQYFVYDYEREGTHYHEFYKGKWDEETFWHPDSISIDDNILYKNHELVDAIKTVIPAYDPYGVTEISKAQWIEIGKLLTDTHSKELYEEANGWLDTIWNEHSCFTVLGL